MAENPVVPCLKEPLWVGRNDALARPLWSGEPSPYMPWVAFGYDRPHTFEFLNRARLGELGKTQDQVERDAVRNLRLRKATWQPVDVKLGWFKKLKLQACGDDFLAAERILDPGFMMEAQRNLGAKGLLVGVPRRGFLVAMDGEQGVDQVKAFATMLVGQFQGGESAPITPIAFALKDGKIVATMGVVAAALLPPEKLGAPAESAEGGADEGAEEDPEAPYVATMVVKNDAGSEDVMIMAGGSDAEKLGVGLVNVLAGVMSQQAENAQWSGDIKVVILAMTPEDVRAQMPSLEAHLKGILSDVAAGYPNKNLRLSMTQQAGNGPFGSPGSGSPSAS